MENKIFILEHEGFWLGGVIIVVSENIETAKTLIETTLLKNGLMSTDFNINRVVEFDEKKSKVVYISTGDY